MGGRPWPWNLLAGVLMMAPGLRPPIRRPGLGLLSGIRTYRGPLLPMIGMVIGGTVTIDGWLLLLAMVVNCCERMVSLPTVTCPVIVLLFLLISYKRCLLRIRIYNTYFFPFWKYGCLKQCSLLDLLVLWKSYMLSCLMKEEKLLCLKNRGRIVSENSFCFFTTKDSPSGDHATMWSYFLS